VALYYLLLFLTPFHADPRAGEVLLDAGPLIITPVKILGLLTVAVACIAPPAKASATRLRSSLPLLFVPFALIPVVATFACGLPMPGAQIGQLISGAMLLVATRSMVRTQQRMVNSVRILVVAFAFGSLWVYKEHFIEHEPRAWGLEGETNYEGLMLLLSSPMAFWMVRHEQNLWGRLIGFGSGLLLVGGVLLTESRAAIVALGAVALLAALSARHKVVAILMLAAAVFVMSSYGPADLSQRFRSIKLNGAPSNGDEQSTRIHVELVKAGLLMIEHHPLLGVGMGQFKSVAPDYNPEIADVAGRSYIAHNTFLQIAAECGLPVLLLFIAMLVVATRNFRTAQRASAPAVAALGTAMQISLAGISVAALSITVEGLPFWILIFLSHNLCEIAETNVAGARKRVVSRTSQAERAQRADKNVAMSASSFPISNAVHS
jgi:O-antigen ligase